MKRQQRLLTEVAPLLARGSNIYEIADVLGISVSLASKDIRLVKDIWAESMDEDMDKIRAEGVARFEDLFRTARQAYDSSVKEGRPNDKFLSLAGSLLDKKHKLQGLSLDVSLVQNNLAIHGEASAETVVGAFAPMAADEYKDFIESKGPLTALPPVPEGDDENLIKISDTKKATPEGVAEVEWQ